MSQYFWSVMVACNDHRNGACRKAGRKCVIIEEDPQYIPVIERRVAEARTPLFDSLPA